MFFFMAVPGHIKNMLLHKGVTSHQKSRNMCGAFPSKQDTRKRHRFQDYIFPKCTQVSGMQHTHDARKTEHQHIPKDPDMS